MAENEPWNSPASAKPWVWRILPDLVAYALGLAIAYFYRWETRDLVWSLWLCSLVLGYLTLLSVLAGTAWAGWLTLSHQTLSVQHKRTAIVAGLAGGLFFLGFFSVHFCGFHAGHSVFLNLFFPLEGLPRDGFGRAFVNPLLLWILVFRHLMASYGIFLLPALISERKHVFRPLMDAFRAWRQTEPACGGVEPNSLRPESSEPRRDKTHNVLGEAMKRPYINVVRMHLLIFFFAIAHAARIDSFTVYVVVYSVYFFPWAEFRRFRIGKACGGS